MPTEELKILGGYFLFAEAKIVSKTPVVDFKPKTHITIFDQKPTTLIAKQND